MIYEARNRYEAVVGNMEEFSVVEMSYKANSLEKIKEWIAGSIDVCTEYAKRGRVRYSVYGKENDEVSVRMYYTYENRELVSYNKESA